MLVCDKVCEEENQAEEEANDSFINIINMVGLLWPLAASLASGSTRSSSTVQYYRQAVAQCTAEEEPMIVTDSIVNIAGLWRHKV